MVITSLCGGHQWQYFIQEVVALICKSTSRCDSNTVFSTNCGDVCVGEHLAKPDLGLGDEVHVVVGGGEPHGVHDIHDSLILFYISSKTLKKAIVPFFGSCLSDNMHKTKFVPYLIVLMTVNLIYTIMPHCAVAEECLQNPESVQQTSECCLHRKDSGQLTVFHIPLICKIMAESLLLPLVRGVARKAADALVETMTRMCGLDDDRRMLERHLLAVQCKLANAEDRSETNDYVKSWMKELKSVAYEADDVLDDFQYEALRRQSKIGKSTTRKVLSYITRHSPLLFRFEMSRKLKNVLKKINKLVKEMNTFGLESSARGEEQQHPWRQTHSKLDDSKEIFGRDGDKKMVVKLLLDQQHQWKVQVLPIFGMGGIGKTTLAKMVYNDKAIQDHFQLKMWHCVSDNFDVIALVKSIIELATNGSSAMPGSIELLQKKLDEVIGQQRFLLVLDDVWNEDKRIWEDELKSLLCSVGGPGSVIVVTCRNKQVASIMSTVKPHELVFLCEEDSWELFSNKAFGNGIEEQADLVTIGRRIVDKCGGLPLALKPMGGLLSSKQKVQEWKAIEQSSIGDNVGGKYEVMPILKLSYKELSSEMKQCFAFCAVFPKDYEMEKDRLIQLWMANGFIQEEGTTDLIQKGEFIFDEFVWRSFLQDKKVVLKSIVYASVTEYETVVCKMHDLMHDLAKEVTDECESIDELTQQKALLKAARHMQMAETKLEQISMLCKGGTYLRTLLAPSDLWKSQMYFSKPWSTEKPSHINNIFVGAGDGLGIEQLKDLQHLSNRLELFNLSKIKSGANAKEANLGQKQNLSELLFSWDQEMDGEPRYVEEVFQCLEPHSNIQKLEIRGYNGLEISQWMRKPQMFDCLRELKMSGCPKCKSIPVRMELIELPILEMWAENSVGEPSDILIMFPMLGELTIKKCPKLASIPVIPIIINLRIIGVHSSAVGLVFIGICLGSWPFLVRLALGLQEDIPMLHLDAQQSQSQRPLDKLKHLYLEGPNSLVTSSGLSSSHLMVWKCFSSVKGLTISECSNLVCWPTEELRCLDSLRLLYIMNCNNLEGKTSSAKEETLPLSLEALTISSCCSVVALPSNLGNLTKLKGLNVSWCNALKALPDGLCGLTSLRESQIWGCPTLKKLPQGLLERLSALKRQLGNSQILRNMKEAVGELAPGEEARNDVTAREVRSPSFGPISPLCTPRPGMGWGGGPTVVLIGGGQRGKDCQMKLLSGSSEQFVLTDAKHIQFWFLADCRCQLANDFRFAKVGIGTGFQDHDFPEAEEHTYPLETMNDSLFQE
uniref:Putative disease resistance protein RGA3 n=1 Tax=Aegilops tauschii TaxID=37682 RepID=N1R3D9_AEGTA